VLSGFGPSFAPVSIQRRISAMVSGGSGDEPCGIRLSSSSVWSRSIRRLVPLLPAWITGPLLPLRMAS
jgi:hypothetical protein